MHQTYVDVGVMARHLQEKYRDYARRKVQPFRYLVDQGTKLAVVFFSLKSTNFFLVRFFVVGIAYKTVLHSYGLDSNPSSEDDENSDLELMEVIFEFGPHTFTHPKHGVSHFHFM